MDDLIRRKDAIDALWKERQQLDDYMDECLKKGLTALRAGTKAERNRIEEDIEIIKELPSEQLERKKGKWIEHTDTRFGIKLNNCIECNCCRVWFSANEMNRRSFCPNCGADMRGENNG